MGEIELFNEDQDKFNNPDSKSLNFFTGIFTGGYL